MVRKKRGVSLATCAATRGSLAAKVILRRALLPKKPSRVPQSAVVRTLPAGNMPTARTVSFLGLLGMTGKRGIQPGDDPPTVSTRASGAEHQHSFRKSKASLDFSGDSEGRWLQDATSFCSALMQM
ncbi:hypothetical protein TRVL_03690 [Trypanosoma vivax]|nr:hypothetical protein TRVL_03690 [Trypanosoma vivax]